MAPKTCTRIHSFTPAARHGGKWPDEMSCLSFIFFPLIVFTCWFTLLPYCTKVCSLLPPAVRFISWSAWSSLMNLSSLTITFTCVVKGKHSILLLLLLLYMYFFLYIYIEFCLYCWKQRITVVYRVRALALLLQLLSMALFPLPPPPRVPALFDNQQWDRYVAF